MEKTSTLEKERKQRSGNRHDTDSHSDDSSSSSSSSNEDSNEYENVPNTVETKILTLKREKAALKQQLKVTSAIHMNFEAAFQTEFDLRTSIEEKLDNLREKYEVCELLWYCSLASQTPGKNMGVWLVWGSGQRDYWYRSMVNEC